MALTTQATRVVEAAETFLAAVSEFEPSSAPPADCVAVAAAAARVEKGASGLRVLAGAHAVDAGAHKEDGVANPVSWVARQGGTTGAEARQALELAKCLAAHPETRMALLEGAVSLAQAREIARAEEEAPGQEHELLEVAKHGDLTTLRDETRERRLSRTKPEALHEAQLASRRFRHWRDGLGMVCFDGALPPETGIPLVSRIEREAARLRRAAMQDERAERFEAYAADALVRLSEGGNAAKGATDLVIVCDLYAWRRGYAHDGEPCHLIGGGPIPVGLAKELGKDAFLKVVLHDGVDIQKIHHVGRKYTAQLRTALLLGAAPSFTGRACIDCGRSWGLQNDHDDPVAHTGPTSYNNVKPRCYDCHREKTVRDRKAGLLRTRGDARDPGGRAGAPARARSRSLPERKAEAPARANAASHKRVSPGRGNGAPGKDPPSATGP